MSVYDQVSGQPAVYEFHQLLAVSKDEKRGRGANAHTASGPKTRESVEAGCTSSDLLRLVNGPCGNPNRTQVLNGPFSCLGLREFGMVSLMWCSTDEVGSRCVLLGVFPIVVWCGVDRFPSRFGCVPDLAGQVFFTPRYVLPLPSTSGFSLWSFTSQKALLLLAPVDGPLARNLGIEF
jgi:hypothetical protein